MSFEKLCGEFVVLVGRFLEVSANAGIESLSKKPERRAMTFETWESNSLCII